MAELATLARPYAEALFQVAEKGDLKQASVAKRPEQVEFCLRSGETMIADHRNHSV